MELLNKTRVPVKSSGDGLSHKDVNNINSAINNTVDVVNLDLINYCNINQEIKNYSKTFNFQEAVNLVPQSRRSPGLRLKYLGLDNSYKEFIFSCPSVTKENWVLEENWKLPFDNIDGGEWEISDDF